MAMTTVVDSAAVQVHQTERPIGHDARYTLVSAGSVVAPTSVPENVTDEPVRGVRWAKSSLGGGV